MVDIKVGEIILKFNYSASDIDDIRRCLSTLYATATGTMPNDRDFGLDQSFLDMPPPIAKSEFTLEVVEKTEIYEPRVNVEGVTFASDPEGSILYATIELSKGGEI